MGFNAKEFEYADIKVAMLGVEVSGLRGLKYKTSQEKEVVYGAGNEPLSIQRGNKKYDGTLRLLKSDYDTLDRAAIAAGYQGITDVPSGLITITCVYAKPNSVDFTTDILKYLEFTEAEDGMNQNDKFSEISLPFIFLRKKKV